MRQWLFTMIALTIWCLYAATPGTAGQYTVHGCGAIVATPDGWRQAPEGSFRDFFWSYVCDPQTGLRLQTSPFAYARGSIDHGKRGAWQFLPPSDTKIVEISGSALLAGSSELAADLVDDATGQILRTLPTNAQWTSFTSLHAGLSALSAGLRCTRAPTCRSQLESWFLRDLRVRIRDDARPTISAPQPIEDRWYGSDLVPFTLQAADNVGIKSFHATLDGIEVTRSETPCLAVTNSVVRPCASENYVIRATVDAARLVDGEHTVVATAIDPGGMYESRKFTFRVDHTPPATPRRLRLSGGDQWRATNRFDIAWSSPSQEGTAPIDGIEFAFCPSSNSPYDPTGCVHESRTIDPASETDTISVPRDGSWTVRVGLRDAAGNFDSARVATLEPLRLDSAAPTGAFLPVDSTHPTRIRLAARDSLSGLSVAEIELRRVGDDAWHSYAARISSEEVMVDVDDAVLPAGEYDVRARLVDAAGNEATISGGARMHLPVRMSGSLAAGKPVRVRVKTGGSRRPTYRTRLVGSPTVPFGASIPITGTLHDVAGTGRAGAPVAVLQSDTPGGSWRSVRTLTTGSGGGFSFRLPAGPSRRVKLVYAGDATSLPLAKEIDVRVRAGVTIRPSRTRVRNGERVVFRGKLLGDPIPDEGKLLHLQALTSRGWQTFATPRARARGGKWSATYRFNGTSVRTRYSFRVVAPTEAGYRYVEGKSSITRVLVLP